MLDIGRFDAQALANIGQCAARELTHAIISPRTKRWAYVGLVHFDCGYEKRASRCSTSKEAI
jgi:hypothetical protein